MSTITRPTRVSNLKPVAPKSAPFGAGLVPTAPLDRGLLTVLARHEEMVRGLGRPMPYTADDLQWAAEHLGRGLAAQEEFDPWDLSVVAVSEFEWRAAQAEMDDRYEACGHIG